MNKSNKTERTATVTTAPAAQSKRYDATFKREAVENWIKSSKPGTQIAAELGISYQTSPTAKQRSPPPSTRIRQSPGCECGAGIGGGAGLLQKIIVAAHIRRDLAGIDVQHFRRQMTD